MAVPVFTLNFPAYTAAPTVSHRVYLKRAWTDAWTYIPWLFCDQATWCLAPSIPTAILDWDVGFINRQGRLQPSWFSPLAIGRYYVKIETACHASILNPGPVDPGETIKPTLDNPPALLKWWGSCEVSQEMLDGAKVDNGVVLKTGHQKLTCYGLAQELFRTPLDGHWWCETANPTADHYSYHPGTFNERDAQGRIAGNMNFVGGVFSDKVQIDDDFWSTRTAVDYLCRYHSPRLTSAVSPLNVGFFGGVNIAAGEDVILPDWDRPCIAMRGKNVWQVLNELMHRGRLLSFYLDVDEIAGGLLEEVKLHPVSLADADIFTNDGWLLANQRQWNVQHHNDRACSASLRKNTLQAVDQFVIRGARRASIVSIGYQDGTASLSSTLEKGWTAAQETEYEAAASGGAGYGAATNEEKQRQNAQSRARDEVYQVYRRFQIPDAWSYNCKVKDGRGGTALVDAFLNPMTINPRELRILPTLPLKDGYDYAGSVLSSTLALPATRVSLGPHENLRPLVFFQIPDQTSRWIEGSQIGRLGKEETSKKQNHKMSLRVQIPEKDKAILLEVHGQPQHAIAFTDFSKLPVDPYCGEWDWKTAVFTVALEDDRYCEGRWPSDAALMVRDVELRRVVIDAGDDYRQDWIAPHTALSVHKETGVLVESTAGGYTRKDDTILQSKAQLAYGYWSRTRSSLTISCDRPTNVLRLGDLIATTSPSASDAVGSVVSQLTLTIPHANAATVHEAVSFEIETAHAELDFLEDILQSRNEKKGLAY